MTNESRSLMKTISLQSRLARRLLASAAVLLLAAAIVLAAIVQESQGAFIFGLVVLASGLMLLVHRHYIEIDREAGILNRRRGFLFGFRVQSIPISEVEMISLIPRAVRRNEEDHVIRFRITVKGKKKATLTEISNPAAARRTCESLCKALGVPFENRVYGPSSVRNADELDLSVAERWRRARARKVPPALPAQTTLEVAHLPDELRISMPAERFNLKFVAFIAAIFGIFAAIFFPLMDKPAERVFFILFFGASGLFLIYAALAFAGTSRVRIRNGSIEFRQGSLPNSRKIPIDEIEELIPAGDGLYLVGDAKTVWIQYSGRKPDNEYVQQYLEYEIARHHTGLTVDG